MNEEEQYREDPSFFYTERFFQKMKRPGGWQRAVGKMVAEKYAAKSAIDIGCGLGYYLAGAKDAGATRLVGLEYMYENAKNHICSDVVDFVKAGNAMEPISEGTFDLVISIEVAEHILSEATDQFLENITQTSDHIIFLTAAPPGQGGTAHINERPRDFWIDAVEERGFSYLKEDVDSIRRGFKDLPFRGKYMNLIRKQIMLFGKAK